MGYRRTDLVAIHVSRDVADRLSAARVTMRLRGHDARIVAADRLLTEAMDKRGVPTFPDVKPVEAETVPA